MFPGAGFRVLSEAERTAALYSLLQHSTQVQIRFFMTVLQQMAGIDSMSALMSPAVGSGGGGHGMQAQMEAKLAGLRSPVASRQSFGASNRDSYGGGGGLENAHYLNPDAVFTSDAVGKANNNKASNRTSAPGLLNPVTPSWGAANSGLDQVLERGPSPGAESNMSGRSGGDSRPKSTDFSGHANVMPGSASYPKSPQGKNTSSRADDIGSLPLSPNVTTGNWASMVNTPAVPMFGAVSQTGSNLPSVNDHPAFSVPKLSDAPKRRTSGKMGPAGLSSPGSLGGGFQGSAGAWSAQRSPAPGVTDGGFSNNFGLGIGSGGASGFNAIGSPSPSDLALQMSQLQLQQLQIQQLQQLQQLGVAGAANGLGMGLGMPMGLGMGMPGLPGGGNVPYNGLGAGAGSRNVSARSMGSASNGGARRSPMLGGSGFAGSAGAAKSPSPVGRRESAGTGGVGGVENEDVDIRVLEDVSQWLRTLRLHVSHCPPAASLLAVGC